MNKPTFDAMLAQYAVKTVSGKNLCDLSVDAFNAKGFWAKSDFMDESFCKIAYQKNTQYTVSWDATLPEGSEAVYYIRFQYAGGGSSGYGGFEVVDARYDLDGVRSITSRPGETVERIFATAGIGGSFTLHWIQVEEGSSATAYEPYLSSGVRRWDNGVHCVLPEVQIGGKVEQKHYEGYNRLQLDGKTENNQVAVSYDPNTQIFTLNGTKTLPGNLILSDAAHINWDGAEKFWTVRQKIGGNVTLDENGVGRYLLWSVFTNDYNSYTCRTKCTTQDESKEFVANVVSGVGKIEQSPAGSGYRILLQCLGCSAENPIVFDNYQVRLMITETDTNDWSIPTAYEPYTGGVPAPNPQYPIMPTFSDGTKVVSRGRNLADIGSRYSSWGGDQYTTVVREGLYQDNQLQSTLIPVIGGETYCATWEGVTLNGRYFWFDQQPVTDKTVSIDGGYFSSAYPRLFMTAPEDAKWLLFIFFMDSNWTEEPPVTDCQIALGAIATSYEPYFDGGEAVAPELLAIPGTEYRDEWDAQTGKGVCRIGEVVFDDPSKWINFSNYGFYGLQHNPPSVQGTKNGFCSHHEYLYKASQGGFYMNNNGVFYNYDTATWPTMDDWKAFLQAQIDAGTPVTVWYALSEPVEFQTEPQPLTQPKGSCEIIQTEGAIPDCPILVKYLTHK